MPAIGGRAGRAGQLGSKFKQLNQVLDIEDRRHPLVQQVNCCKQLVIA